MRPSEDYGFARVRIRGAMTAVEVIHKATLSLAGLVSLRAPPRMLLTKVQRRHAAIACLGCSARGR